MSIFFHPLRYFTIFLFSTDIYSFLWLHLQEQIDYLIYRRDVERQFPLRVAENEVTRMKMRYQERLWQRHGKQLSVPCHDIRMWKLNVHSLFKLVKYPHCKFTLTEMNWNYFQISGWMQLDILYIILKIYYI